jgi:ABC-type proline/glycine betaine transport system permease subunit
MAIIAALWYLHAFIHISSITYQTLFRMKNILYQHNGSWENEISILCLVYIAVGLSVIETIELKGTC